VSVSQSRLAQAARALQANDLPTAEIILRARLLDQPTDVHALRMMADLGFRLGSDEDAEPLLHYALELEPGFAAAKLDLAKQLYLHNRYEEALVLIGEVLEREPDHEGALYMKGVVLGHAGRFEEAIAVYQDLVERLPDRARLWASYGRSLKTVGRSQEGIAAFRRAAEIDPRSAKPGGACPISRRCASTTPTSPRWKPASPGRRSPPRTDIISTSRSARRSRASATMPKLRPLCRGQPPPPRTARARRRSIHRLCDRGEATFTAEFFDARRGQGSPIRDPIFILGMTRAGSTLIEQILASHPAIEGTMELPNVLNIAKSVADEFEDRVSAIAALGRIGWSSLASAMFARPAATGRPIAPSSSTRCRTTGSTSR
jgi:tetratricopeptide (TPR) repeat protein